MNSTLENLCEHKLTKRVTPPLQYDEFEECSCFNCSGFDYECSNYKVSTEIPKQQYKLYVGGNLK
jgi:hypothetical protein